MPKTIDMNLSQSSIQSAIKKLERYKRQLATGNKQLVDRLGKLGEEYVQENSKYTDCDSGTVSHKTNAYGALNTAACQVNWTGSEITFIEFGAGIYFNGGASGNPTADPLTGRWNYSPHPKGVQMGMTIGDYGYRQGRKESWKKPDGEWTHGTPALMPMWRAINADDGITKMVADVGREVFDK